MANLEDHFIVGSFRFILFLCVVNQKIVAHLYDDDAIRIFVDPFIYSRRGVYLYFNYEYLTD